MNCTIKDIKDFLKQHNYNWTGKIQVGDNCFAKAKIQKFHDNKNLICLLFNYKDKTMYRLYLSMLNNEFVLYDRVLDPIGSLGFSVSNNLTEDWNKYLSKESSKSV